MNQHLKSAVKRGLRRKSFLINPISKADAEIITELIISLGKIKADEIKDIIEQWKYLKDETIAEMLLDWNISHPDSVDDGENKGRRFVEFEGEVVELALMKTIQKDDYYNYNTHEYEYRIVVNKDFPESFLISDLVFKFSTPEVREEKIAKLKKVLRKYVKIIG